MSIDLRMPDHPFSLSGERLTGKLVGQRSVRPYTGARPAEAHRDEFITNPIAHDGRFFDA
jgi:hypothetical protein